MGLLLNSHSIPNASLVLVSGSIVEVGAGTAGSRIINLGLRQQGQAVSLGQRLLEDHKIEADEPNKTLVCFVVARGITSLVGCDGISAQNQFAFMFDLE